MILLLSLWLLVNIPGLNLEVQKNALVKFLSSEKKIIDGKEITDSIVRLGKEGISQMSHNLRLLEIPDDKNPNKIIRIISNNFNRSAQELSNLYRNRWQIELFFKWIKQHFHVKVFYGHSQNAVKNHKNLFTVLRLIQ